MKLNFIDIKIQTSIPIAELARAVHSINCELRTYGGILSIVRSRKPKVKETENLSMGLLEE